MKKSNDYSISNGIMKTMLMNHLNGRAETAKKIYLDIYLKSLNESKKLLDEALILFKSGAHERAYFLGFSALEEISKSQIAKNRYDGFGNQRNLSGNYRPVFR